MSVLTPPKPPVHEDPEALIEEARRRARRRRLAFVAAVVAGLAIVGTVLAVVLIRGSGTGAAVPEGFHLVRARGPVEHTRTAEYLPFRPTVIDHATGREHRVPYVTEAWWDRKSGLVRAIVSVDGRVGLDGVGQTCQPKPRVCFPLPLPFDLAAKDLKWPVDPKYFRVAGTGTFHGHRVNWVANKGGATVLDSPRDRLAYDAATHRLVGSRRFVGPKGRGFWFESVFTVLRDLPASRVTFVVPVGGVADIHSYPPSPQPDTVQKASSVRAARSALGTVPLWLGSSFRGHKLEGVEVGTEGMFTEGFSGAVLRRAPFVTFDYGKVKLQEFGSKRPFWYEQGPRPGRIVYDGGRAALTRDGLLLLATLGEAPTGPDHRVVALAVANALRPVPGG